MNKEGHIYAPVSVEDLREVLGELSTDVGTLCMSEKINPYSLIRPIPADSPNIAVTQMKNLHLGTLPGSRGDVLWAYKQWGYHVPYVRNPQLIDSVKDLAWYRPSADESHYKSLNHFDGYLHDVVPFFIWDMGDVQSGDEIIVMLGLGAPQTDIVSESGQGNNGGVVSILEVFGDAPFYYGVRIKYGSNYRFAYGADAVLPGQTSMGVIYTGITAQAGMTYEITPFISTTKDTVTAQTQVFSLNFSPNHISSKSVYIPETTVSVGLMIAERNDNEITKLRIVLQNNYRYAWETKNLQLKIVTYYPFDIGGGNVAPDQMVVPGGNNTTTSYRMLDATLRVEGQDTFIYEWETIIRKDMTALYCAITASGTLTSVYGNTERYETNLVILN